MFKAAGLISMLSNNTAEQQAVVHQTCLNNPLVNLVLEALYSQLGIYLV
jgi:hypothetical protein